jgi:hypothetical protein
LASCPTIGVYFNEYKQPDGYLVEIEQPAGAGSTEPAESEGVGSAGAEAAAGVGWTEPAESEGVGSAGSEAAAGVGWTEPARSEGAGFAGAEAGQ